MYTIKQLGDKLITAATTVSTAESCTGGKMASLLTSFVGSSHFFLGGVIAYSNQAKQDLLGVHEEDLIRYGAVSEVIATQMALGVCRIISSDYGISSSGIAGPHGGTQEIPVGTVYLALAYRKEILEVQRLQLKGNRSEITQQSAQKALEMLSKCIK